MLQRQKNMVKALNSLAPIINTSWVSTVNAETLCYEAALELQRLSELEETYKSLHVLLLVMDGLMFNALVGTDKPELWESTWDQILKEAGLK